MKSNSWLKQRYRAFCIDVWNEARFDLIPKYVHPECRFDDIIIPGKESVGYKPLEGAVRLHHQQMKSFRVEAPLLIAEAGQVSGRVEMHGIASGPMFPSDKIGKPVRIDVSGLLQFDGALIVHVTNFISLQQAGLKLLG